MRRRPLAVELLRGELVESNPLTQALTRYRSRQTENFQKLLGPVAGLDVQAVTAVLYGGLAYLLLKSGAGQSFSGLNLSQERDWDRLEKAMVDILSRLLV